MTKCFENGDPDLDPEEYFIQGDEAIMIGSDLGHLLLIEVATGKIIFQKQFTSAVNTLSAQGQIVFFGTEDGSVGYVNAKSLQVGAKYKC